MLTPRFPYPPNRGDTLRAWFELEHLAERHEIWLASLNHGSVSPARVRHARRVCREVCVVPLHHHWSLLRGAASLLRGQTVTEGYFADARLEQMLRRWTKQTSFDAVLTYSSAMAPYATLVAARRRVLDMVDVDSHKWRVYADRALPPLSWLFRTEHRRLAEREVQWCKRHDVCLLVNERERARLNRRVPAHRTAVLRTALDIEAYSPRDPGTVSAYPTIGFVGSMFYPPNVRAVEWFASEVWPRVQARVPNAKWWIVGKGPSRAIRALGRKPGIHVTGEVDDVGRYLHQMRVFVNPVDGDIGVQSKLIVAMAAGRACVVTPDAAAGIDYVGRPPFAIASDPVDFATAVAILLQDDRQAHSLQRRARAAVRHAYDYQQQGMWLEHWLQTDPTGGTAVPPAAIGDSDVSRETASLVG